MRPMMFIIHSAAEWLASLIVSKRPSSRGDNGIAAKPAGKTSESDYHGYREESRHGAGHLKQNDAAR